jgi:hypothetical protein
MKTEKQGADNAALRMHPECDLPQSFRDHISMVVMHGTPPALAQSISALFNVSTWYRENFTPENVYLTLSAPDPVPIRKRERGGDQRYDV